MISVGLLGPGPRPLHERCTHVLAVPTESPQAIQECHLVLVHALVELAEDLLSDADTYCRESAAWVVPPIFAKGGWGTTSWQTASGDGRGRWSSGLASCKAVSFVQQPGNLNVLPAEDGGMSSELPQRCG